MVLLEEYERTYELNSLEVPTLQPPAYRLKNTRST